MHTADGLKSSSIYFFACWEYNGILVHVFTILFFVQILFKNISRNEQVNNLNSYRVATSHGNHGNHGKVMELFLVMEKVMEFQKSSQ